MYDFEPQTVKDFLVENEVKKAAIQLPSGIRPHVDEIKEPYEEVGVESLFLATSCYGACDIADGQAKELVCDVLVHYGHSDMGLPTLIPTLYVEARMEVDPFGVLDEALSELKGSSWGLVTTVQHIHHLDEIRDYLSENGIESRIGESGPRSKYPGQVLGCDWGSARSVVGEVDGFLYVGTGEFHPLGVVLATGKPVMVLNPVSERFEKIGPEPERFLRKRWAVLSKVESGGDIGVLVSTKKGQERLSLGEEFVEKLENNGYNSYLIVSDELNPVILGDYQLEAFINTACPRIPFSDEESFNVPVLTPFEGKVLLGEQEWGDYQLDEI